MIIIKGHCVGCFNIGDCYVNNLKQIPLADGLINSHLLLTYISLCYCLYGRVSTWNWEVRDSISGNMPKDAKRWYLLPRRILGIKGINKDWLAQSQNVSEWGPW